MKEKTLEKNGSRRTFLKGALVAVAATGIASTVFSSKEKETKSKVRWGMIIDLQRCTGCGACIISCKNENNVPDGFFWSSKMNRTVGKFPNVRYEYISTLCNHCEKAPCVKVCPTQAMHKGTGDITMHDHTKCMGCRYCLIACPYEAPLFNDRKSHKFWRDNKALIPGATSSPEEVTRKVKGNVIPYYNSAIEKTYAGIRPKGVVEKCHFCSHRVKEGELPYCVESCPSSARIFGDLNDPNSNVNQILGKYRSWRLKEHLGTEPKVFYVRSFNAGNYKKTMGSV